MSSTHTTLYRKYRPQSFDDVLGQEEVVSALKGALSKNTIGHAYLFSGSRGTGKTSVARIFARALGISDRDLYEIDAASNRGIDDIRALREEVYTLPFNSPYKMYLIDEAHMLTKEAFNALLKTLEEPPPHVVFVLATTEPEKLPETVRSRCQQCTFRRPTHALLRDMVERTVREEGYTIEPSATELIALLAEGSYRDAHGHLQKVLLVSDTARAITADEVSRVTGAPDIALAHEVLSALATHDLARGLSAIAQASDANANMRLFAYLIISRARAALLLRVAPDSARALEQQYGEDDIAVVRTYAHGAHPITSKTLARLLEATTQVRVAAIPHLPLELALVDLLDTPPSHHP